YRKGRYFRKHRYDFDPTRRSARVMNSLIIDDEAAARSRLARLLSAHSNIKIVGEASDGLQALEKIGQLRPDLVFLDIQMPGLDGFAVLRSIPADVLQPLVVFVTG